jgi:hypothetical protein
MPQGLQLFNEAGNLILDIGSRPLKILQVSTISAGTNQTISIPPNTGTVVPIPLLPETLESPQFTVSPTQVTVTWAGNFGSGVADLLIMEF